METIHKQTSELGTYKKRIEILIGARFRETGRVSSAVDVQNRIRKKTKHWQRAEEVRKRRMRN